MAESSSSYKKVPLDTALYRCKCPLSGLEPMFLPNSQLAAGKVSHPSVLGLQVGQEIHVKYFGRDPSTGQARLSRRAVMTAQAAAVAGASSMRQRESPR